MQQYEQHKSTACTEANQYGCGNQLMQHAIRNGLGGKVPRGIKLSLAGHMPHFQSLTFSGSARPAQLIIGHSGGEPEARGPAGSFEATIQGAKAQGRAIGQSAPYGFFQLTYDPDGSWEGSVEDLQKSVELASCGSRQAAQGAVCEITNKPVAASFD
ncbi:MAG: hypothetical protein GY953_25420 [bacterium]|nr:hypothetical protein [bacterium]